MNGTGTFWGGIPRSIVIIIITIAYHLIYPPFLPDLRTVLLILISEVIFYRIFEFPKLAFEQSLCEFVCCRCCVVIDLYNYATFVEVEIMFGAFGIVRFRAEYCVTLETKIDKDDVTH